jgi:hypothetical protein
VSAVDHASAELERVRGGYLPTNWHSEQGPGEAFTQVLANLAELVDEGLERAPDHEFLAFLDAMGATLLPPSPARAPVVFAVASNAPIDVPLPEDSEVAAVKAPPLPTSLGGAPASPAPPPEPVIFATDRGISLARANLASVHSLLPETDELADHTERLEEGFTLFDEAELVPHHLYLGHETLFDLGDSADIGLQVGVARPPAPGLGTTAVELAWEYLTADGWFRFEPVRDHTQGLTNDGEVLLSKVSRGQLVKGTVNGVESFWIRARVVPDPSEEGVQGLPLPGTKAEAPLPRIDTLRARVAVRRAGLRLDAALNDALPLDTSKDFLPFGLQAELGSSFLVACDDAFKRDARIELTVEPADSAATYSNNRELTWEYSVGEGAWKSFSPDTDEALAKQGEKEQFQKPPQGGAAKRVVSFPRPSEWQKATVAGQSHFWLRVRVSKGRYGSSPGFNVSSGQPTGGPAPPILRSISVGYVLVTGSRELDHCLTRNRFDYEDRTEAARWGREAFQPFQPVPDRQPAVYLGFDQSLPIGLVSLFAQGGVTDEPAEAPRPSPFTWEYRSTEGWSELPVLDETAGFRRSGMVQFIGQPDQVPDTGPEGPLHWVRARLKTATGSPELLPLAGLRLNAVWATNRTAVRGEVVGRSDGSPGQALALQHGSVLPNEKVEVQEWRGSGRDWESLFRDLSQDHLRFDRDPRGNVVGVWVRWRERPHLYGSGHQDRHYAIERTGGLLRFGDGEAGMIPPPGAPITASYEFGGGADGNVGAGAIAQLHTAPPYVESVTNPIAAAGGAPAESSEEVPATLRYPLAAGGGRQSSGGIWARGPMMIRHRGRGISAADIEWLAHEASSEVALARCLAATGPDGEGMPGWITVVVVSRSELAQPQPSGELMRRVREHLARRAPAAIAAQVRVVGPRYQPVAVSAEVVVTDPDRAAEIEEELRDRLGRFLHPLYGGLGGTGWEFGESVRLSHVATLIETTQAVAYAEEVQLSVEGAVFGESVQIPVDRLPASGRHLLKLRVEV